MEIPDCQVPHVAEHDMYATVSEPTTASADASSSVFSEKPFNALVIDTGPLIKNEISISTLVNQAQVLFTVPSVISEIRDNATRSRVQTTLVPFLKLRNPRPESIKFVSGFARRTGDLEVLSKTDLHLLALSYELDCERNRGDSHLRRDPTQKGINGHAKGKKNLGTRDAEMGVPVEATHFEDSTNCQCAAAAEDHTTALDSPSSEGASEPVSTATASTENAQPPSETNETVEDASAGRDEPRKDVADVANIENKASASHLSIEDQKRASAPEQDSTQQGVEQKDPSQKDDYQPLESGRVSYHKRKEAKGRENSQKHAAEQTSEEDSDGGEWITPDNIQEIQKRGGGSANPRPPRRHVQTALLTSDMAMHNVALRIGLYLLDTNMSHVTTVKTWVLRCQGCFQVTRNMAKQFCPNCGQATLSRVSCSTDRSGQFRIHLKKNFQFNTRGNVYSIPKPVHGSASGKVSNVKGGGHNGWGQGLILAEDQKEYTRKADENRRAKARDFMDEDYLPSILLGSNRGPGGSGRIKVGAGRHVNAKKRK